MYTLIRRAVLGIMLVLGALTSGVLLGAEPEPPSAKAAKPGDADFKPTPEQLGNYAKQTWLISDLIVQNHIKPCPREEMLLGGILAAFKAAGVEAPKDVEKRVADLKSAADFQALAAEYWLILEKQKVPFQKLSTAMMQGMFAKVSGEPALLPDDYLKIAEQISGNRYVGVGIQIAYDQDRKYARINDPFRRGPARKAGAKANDLIVSVDGRDAHNVDLQTIVKWLRGEEGTKVTIGVRQPDSTEVRLLTMTRSVVPFDSVFGFQRNGEDGWRYRVDPALPMAYLWTPSIRSSTVQELRQVERRLVADGIRAIILDTRESDNQTMLHDAALLADSLLDGGVMFRTRDAQGTVKEYKADRECLFRDWPMVVITKDNIDRGQGAVLAALQDNHRAILVGEPTKADGYGNSLIPVPNAHGALKVRSFRIERAAAGKTWPVVPDQMVALTPDQNKAVTQWLRAKQKADQPADVKDEPPEDPQLAKAVELLREKLNVRSEKPRNR